MKRVGLALVALYALTALVSTRIVPGHVRPLFEGFAPAPYKWVKPPPALEAGNTKPASAKISVNLGAGGSDAANPGTDDAQALISLGANAIAPHPPDTKVDIAIIALDPAGLGKLPAGEFSNGNAYRITFTYEPSGVPVGTLENPGNVILRFASHPGTLIFSTDGRSWATLQTNVLVSELIETATFTRSGYYVAAATKAPTAGGGGPKHGIPEWVITAVAIGIPTLFLVVFVLPRRDRRAAAPRGQRPPPRRRRVRK